MREQFLPIRLGALRRSAAVLVVACAAALFSCAKGPPALPEADRAAAGDLFSRAASLDAAGVDDQAMVLYQDYVAMYPGGPNAPQALVRLAQMELAAGRALLA
ncbi:MAG: hypothetical protein JRI97_13360, partial [Deltaproteobacteria bacterium]|nr:hypothetical protein [Deltaproteobacteria bacterium]